MGQTLHHTKSKRRPQKMNLADSPARNVPIDENEMESLTMDVHGEECLSNISKNWRTKRWSGRSVNEKLKLGRRNCGTTSGQVYCRSQCTNTKLKDAESILVFLLPTSRPPVAPLPWIHEWIEKEHLPADESWRPSHTVGLLTTVKTTKQRQVKF